MYERFPQRDDLDNSEGQVDLRSRYTSLRSEFDIVGRWSQQKTFSTQLIEPGFDDFDPNDPIVDDAPTRVVSDNEITRIQLRPSYAYRYNEKSGLEFGAIAQTVRFKEVVPGRVDYDYGKFDAHYTHTFSAQTDFGIGPYVARYKALDDSYVADSYGLGLTSTHTWSQTFSTDIDVAVEQTNVDRTVPLVESEDSINWSALFGLHHKGAVSETRLQLGRVLTPSSRGAKVAADQIRAQYERALSPRSSITGAVRYVRDTALSNRLSGRDRDYAGAEFYFEWQLSPRWHFQAGYEHLWQKYDIDPDSASDDSVYVGLGYVGQGPRT
jgi:hypothetical protein